MPGAPFTGNFTRQASIPEAGIAAGAVMRSGRLHRDNTLPAEHSGVAMPAPQPQPRTDAVLATLFDMRLSLTFSLADCDGIAGHICDAVPALRLRDAA